MPVGFLCSSQRLLTYNSAKVKKYGLRRILESIFEILFEKKNRFVLVTFDLHSIEQTFEMSLWLLVMI